MNTNASQSERKNSAEWENEEEPAGVISSKLQSSHIHHPRHIEEGKRFDIGVSPLLLRIVNLVLLDGRIHVTHKSGFVWTMDKKFWMERAENEGKFAFVTLLCLSCSQYSLRSYPPDYPIHHPGALHTGHNSVWLHKIVIIRLSVHFFWTCQSSIQLVCDVKGWLKFDGGAMCKQTAFLNMN